MSNLLNRPPTIEPAESRITREVGAMRNRLRHLFDEPLARLFEEPFTLETLPRGYRWLPVVEASETDTAYRLTVELPGLTINDVTVECEGNMLTVRGSKQEEKTSDDRKYHLWERTYGAFLRSFSFPAPIVADDIKAEMKNGVLDVQVPKASPSQPTARKITVNAKE